MKKALIINFNGIGNGIIICPILNRMEYSFPELKYFHIYNKVLESEFFRKKASLNNYLGSLPIEWRRFEEEYWIDIKNFIIDNGIDLIINFRNEGPEYDKSYYKFKKENKDIIFWDLDFNVIGNRAVQQNLTLDIMDLLKSKEVDFSNFNPCWLSEYNKNLMSVNIGFCTVASQINKIWPSEKWVELGNLLKDSVSKINIFSGITNSEIKQSQVIKELTSDDKIEIIKGLDLEKIPEKLGDVNCLISNDTGILHMASAVGITTIGLYTTTDPKVWGVVGCNNTKYFENKNMVFCPYRKVHCGNCAHYYDICPVIKNYGDGIKPQDVYNYMIEEGII